MKKNEANLDLCFYGLARIRFQSLMRSTSSFTVSGTYSLSHRLADTMLNLRSPPECLLCHPLISSLFSWTSYSSVSCYCQRNNFTFLNGGLIDTPAWFPGLDLEI